MPYNVLGGYQETIMHPDLYIVLETGVTQHEQRLSPACSILRLSPYTLRF